MKRITKLSYLVLVIVLSSFSILANETFDQSARPGRLTSLEERQTKEFFYQFSPIGFSQAYGLAFGAMIGAFLSPSRIIEAEFNKSPRQDLAFFGKEVASSEAIALRYKQFFTNSIFINSTIDFRRINYIYNPDALSSETTGSVALYTADLISAQFVFGNQWHFSNLTIGADWIGVSIPLGHSLNENTDRLNSQRASAYSEDKDKILKSVTLIYPRFLIGVSY